ncbi:hypothetical protein ON010_g3908 [Phytophthora cinnamomi]|nr:hypothetical protein ON010_g3908 [Phytophthora cinnamomi]
MLHVFSQPHIEAEARDRRQIKPHKRKETAHGTPQYAAGSVSARHERLEAAAQPHDVQDVQEEAEPGRGDGRAAEPLPGEPARVGAGLERAPLLPDRAVLLVLRGLLRRPVRAPAARQAQRLRAADVRALPAAAAARAPLRRAVPGLQDVPAPGARGGLHPAQRGAHQAGAGAQLEGHELDLPARQGERGRVGHGLRAARGVRGVRLRRGRQPRAQAVPRVRGQRPTHAHVHVPGRARGLRLRAADPQGDQYHQVVHVRRAAQEDVERHAVHVEAETLGQGPQGQQEEEQQRCCQQHRPRGFDHGVFVPMKLIRPQADIPVVTMSINSYLSDQVHFDLGKAIAPFRDEDTLILCSGQSTHNLRGFHSRNPSLVEGARAFQAWLNDTLASESKLTMKERINLITHWRDAPGAKWAHPSPDHFMPFIVGAGAGMEEKEPGAKLIFGGWAVGHFSFANYAWGVQQ